MASAVQSETVELDVRGNNTGDICGGVRGGQLESAKQGERWMAE